MTEILVKIVKTNFLEIQFRKDLLAAINVCANSNIPSRKDYYDEWNYYRDEKIAKTHKSSIKWYIFMLEKLFDMIMEKMSDLEMKLQF